MCEGQNETAHVRADSERRQASVGARRLVGHFPTPVARRVRLLSSFPYTPLPSFMSLRTVRLRVCTLLLCALAAGGCDTSPGAPNTLAQRFADTRDFSSLATVLATAGLTERFDADGEVTVFAPSDAAFEALGDDLVGAVLSTEQRQLLARVLLHHAVAGRLTADDLTDGATLTTLAGTTLRVTRIGPVALVDGVALDLATPIQADNGLAYETQQVMLTALSTRERVALSPTLTRFREQAARAGVLAGTGGATGPVTVLAVREDAYTRLGEVAPAIDGAPSIRRTVLAGHVIPGSVALEALPDGATVTTLDGETLTVTVRRTAQGGEVRRIGGVQVLTGQVTADGRVYVLQELVLATLTLDQLLRVDPQTRRFYNDISRYPDVVAQLADRTQRLTVFAPTDPLYVMRNPDVTAALRETANAALSRRVPLVHVVEGETLPEDLSDGRTLDALDGTVLTVQRGPTTPPRFTGVDIPTETALVLKNGIVYRLFENFIRPAVDPFDTSLLLGLTVYVARVRQVGLETEFRGLDGTLFAFSNDADLTELEPDALRYNVAVLELPADLILSQDTTHFQSLFGRERYIQPNPMNGFALDVRTFEVRFNGVVTDTVDAGQQVGFISRAFDGGGLIYAGNRPCLIPSTPRPQCPPRTTNPLVEYIPLPVASPAPPARSAPGTATRRPRSARRTTGR